MSRFFNLIGNKYFLAATAFIVWMLFFDRNDLMQQFEYRAQLNSLKAGKDFYTVEIAKVKTDLTDLTTNKAKLEKFAREKYLMKKANEDVYVIVKEEPKKKKRSFF